MSSSGELFTLEVGFCLLTLSGVMETGTPASELPSRKEHGGIAALPKFLALTANSAPRLHDIPPHAPLDLWAALQPLPGTYPGTYPYSGTYRAGVCKAFVYLI